MKVDAIRGSIDAIVANASRLLADAEMLELENPPATAAFLARIAQEELAKAFLLCLVSHRIIPWHQHILRATRDHTCKQLLGLVMDHLWPDDDEFDARLRMPIEDRLNRRLPAKVLDAINILRHEKIGRWVSSSWVWADEPDWDKEALSVAGGVVDRDKQDLLYVKLSASGGLAGTPAKKLDVNAKVEMDKAKRFRIVVSNMTDGGTSHGFDWDDIERSFRLVFSDAHTET
jgi:AbiV family abortive infection protein